ncbi:MAG: substrate-binding domain-containing protein [Pseudomonadota bacterium]
MAGETPAEGDDSYLTVKQAARYLHLNEKKIYALVQEGRIPATRATGKWLFPRRLVDEWLLETAHGGALADRLIVAGSDDPLLAYAISHLATETADGGPVAYCPSGTRAGLRMLSLRQAAVAAIHWGTAEEAQVQHGRLAAEYAGHEQWVLVRMARREQGVMLRPGLAPNAGNLADPTLRWLARQAGAGSQRFLETAAAQAGIPVERLRIVQRAHSERETAFLLRQGLADCAPGVRAAAGEFGLDFVPLGWEDFDFVLPRAIYFRHLFQRLLEILRSEPLAQLAQRLGGYDLTALGRVRA